MKIKIKGIINHKFDLPKLNRVNKIFNSLTLTEKVILYFLIGILALSTISMLSKINKYFLIETPAKGGSLVEGSIGSPRFINPLLSISNADRDLTILVYSGLLKATPEGGLVEDLAKEYFISKDGLEYTFILKDDLYFHDKKPITTEDIEFTIKLSQNGTIKSPKRANWDGVRIERINEKEIKFILNTPYSPFLENTTLGILPKHIWGDIEPEQFAFSNFNIEPIGSGPYKITNVSRNSSGIIEKYELESFKKYALGQPYISKLSMNFYPNEEELVNAFSKGNIESINTISPEIAKEMEEQNIRIETVALPRIFGVFFNQNQNSIFTNIEVRKALNIALDRKKIVDEILEGFGVAINNPIPPVSKYFDKNIELISKNTKEAIGILERNGWKLNEETGIREKTIKKEKIPLSFTISTSDAEELKKAVYIIQDDWEKIGADIQVKIFGIGDLNQNVIRPREYDALLFGEVVGRNLDLFAFWHSSQRNDPGLNIAMYVNKTTDGLLEEVRNIHSEKERVEKYQEFQEEISKDIPAIFIYSPNFIYIIPEKIKNFSLGQITMPSERFLSIHKWNIETDTIWKIFTK